MNEEIINASDNIKTDMYAGKNDLIWQESTYPRWIDKKDDKTFLYSKFAVVTHNSITWMSNIKDNPYEPGTHPSWVLWSDIIKQEEYDIVYQEGSKIESIRLNSNYGKIVTSDSSLYPDEAVIFQAFVNNSIINGVVLFDIDADMMSKDFSYKIEKEIHSGFINICITNVSKEILKEKIYINYRILS